jgi:rhamnulokinase
MDANYTNEGGVCGTTRVLKNIMGMWILQECRRNWRLGGACEGYEELAALAQKEKPFRSIFDPDDRRFLPQGDMPEQIRAYCAETRQPMPETHGQFARAIYESLALKYQWAVRRLERDILGHEVSCLHIVGGGSNNALLNQMTANAVGKPVLAGPGEATAIGNLLMQAMALSEIDSLDALRDIVRASFETVEYLPENTGQWQDAYDRFLRITGLMDAR